VYVLVDWLSVVDDEILTFLCDYWDLALPIKAIYVNGLPNRNYDHLRERIPRLAEAGLLYRDPERADYFVLSYIGEAYCNGDLTPEYLERLNPED
jgi:hypothetical protein